jgi:biotin carboxyl carrier protein
MEHEFAYNGETHIVNLENANSDSDHAEAYKASFEDKNYKLDMAKVSPNSFSISFDGLSRTVHIADSDDAVYVHIDGRVVKLDKVTDDVKKFTSDGMEYGAKDEIKTPMPGKIVKMLVEEGQRIEVGQPLVIVESMKMENEIKSLTNGTVKSVNFKDGDLVEPSQAILNLEPDEEES